jgi:hypothetical protein
MSRSTAPQWHRSDVVLTPWWRNDRRCCRFRHAPPDAVARLPAAPAVFLPALSSTHRYGTVRALPHVDFVIP